MNDVPGQSDTNKDILIKYWIEKAEEAIESAEDEYKKGRLSFAVNRVYYACFYAVTALFQRRGQTFRKHKALRSALHRDLVKNGIVNKQWGKFFDEVFESRQLGDYTPIVEFEPDQVETYIG